MFLNRLEKDPSGKVSQAKYTYMVNIYDTYVHGNTGSQILYFLVHSGIRHVDH